MGWTAGMCLNSDRGRLWGCGVRVCLSAGLPDRHPQTHGAGSVHAHLTPSPPAGFELETAALRTRRPGVGDGRCAVAFSASRASPRFSLRENFPPGTWILAAQACKLKPLRRLQVARVWIWPEGPGEAVAAPRGSPTPGRQSAGGLRWTDAPWASLPVAVPEICAEGRSVGGSWKRGI